MSRKIYQFLFRVFIRHLPEGWGKKRTSFVCKYAKFVGENVNIGRKCVIHKNTEIGNNSGVGYACEINNGVHIGNNVMMGPNVLIYTQNHRTDRTDIPMREQGMREIEPARIEDDVWIGARVCILPGGNNWSWGSCWCMHCGG